MSKTYAGFSIGGKVTVVVDSDGFSRENLGKTGTILSFDEGDSLDVYVVFDDGVRDWGRVSELRQSIPTLQHLEALRAELARVEAAYAENSAEKTMQTIRDNQDTLQKLYMETQVLARSIGKSFGFDSGYEEFQLEDTNTYWDSSSASC